MNAKALGTTLIVGGMLALAGTGCRSVQHDRTPITSEPSDLPPGGAPSGSVGLSTQDIRQVQQALRARGYNTGKADGVLDSTTKDAISAFQKDQKIPITGSPDPETAQKLGVQLSSGQRSR